MSEPDIVRQVAGKLRAMACSVPTLPPGVTSAVVECSPPSGGNWQYVIAAGIAAVALALTTFFTLRANRKSNDRALDAQRIINTTTLENQRQMSLDAFAAERKVASDKLLFEKRADFYPELIQHLQDRNNDVLPLFATTDWRPLHDACKNHTDILATFTASMMAFTGKEVQAWWVTYHALHGILGLTAKIVVTDPHWSPTSEMEGSLITDVIMDAGELSRKACGNLIRTMRAELQDKKATGIELLPIANTSTMQKVLNSMTKTIEEYEQDFLKA